MPTDNRSQYIVHWLTRTTVLSTEAVLALNRLCRKIRPEHRDRNASGFRDLVATSTVSIALLLDQNHLPVGFATVIVVAQTTGTHAQISEFITKDARPGENLYWPLLHEVLLHLKRRGVRRVHTTTPSEPSEHLFLSTGFERSNPFERFTEVRIYRIPD
jgi:hypothetical protein